MLARYEFNQSSICLARFVWPLDRASSKPFWAAATASEDWCIIGIGQGQIIKCIDVVGSELHRPLEMFDRLLGPRCLQQRGAQNVADLRVIGLKPQCLPVLFDCLPEPACFDQCAAQIDVSLDIVGIKFYAFSYCSMAC